jgi:hypothetical protein
MLKHVEHKDEIVSFPGIETGVERSHRDPASVGAPGIDKRRLRFDPFYLPELPQTFEEKPVAATHVQDRKRPRVGKEPMKFFY